MTEIGQAPNTQQLQAINSHWLNLMDTERVVASIVTQMVFAVTPNSRAGVGTQKGYINALLSRFNQPNYNYT